MAEQQARQAVEMRTKVQKELAAREKAKKDAELRNLAIRARMDRTGAAPAGITFAWLQCMTLCIETETTESSLKLERHQLVCMYWLAHLVDLEATVQSK